MATLARSNFSCFNICHCLIVLQNYEWRKELICRTLQWCSAVPLVGCLSTNDKDGGGRKAVLSHVASLFLSTSTTRHFGPSDDSPQIYAFSAALLTTTNITCSRNRVMRPQHCKINTFWSLGKNKIKKSDLDLMPKIKIMLLILSYIDQDHLRT